MVDRELEHTEKLRRLYSDESLEQMCNSGILEVSDLYVTGGDPIDCLSYIRQIPDVTVE